MGHRLHPGRDADVVVSSLDGGGDVGDGLQAGGALAIHGANGNLLREAGEEHGYAALVGALGGVAEDGTDDDVADVGRVQTGRGDGRLEKGGEEVVVRSGVSLRPPFLARVMGVRSALTTTMSSGDLRWRKREKEI